MSATDFRVAMYLPQKAIGASTYKELNGSTPRKLRKIPGIPFPGIRIKGAVSRIHTCLRPDFLSISR